MQTALYRKYRPQTFSDICGQEHITKTLRAQIAEGHLSHAYLFAGSRGTGKTSCAKILAKAVNCLHPQNGDPCNACEICRGIDDGSIMDISEIDAASNNGVDNIRELRENIAYTPARANYRVYIIDEVHMLSDSAFNALLKTLEEPPAYVIFVLATTEVYQIPATVLSRCQRYDFNRIAADVIARRLSFVAEREKLRLDDAAAQLIAKLSDGGMRDALSLLGLCASGNTEITAQLVAQCAGLAGSEHLFTLSAAVAAGDAAAVLAEIDRLYHASCDMERLCGELIAHYRNLLVCKAVKQPETLVHTTKEELEKLRQRAGEIRFEHILYAMDQLQQCMQLMKRGKNQRIAMETAMIRLCMPALDTSVSALADRIAKLEDAVKLTGLRSVPQAMLQRDAVEAEKQVGSAGAEQTAAVFSADSAESNEQGTSDELNTSSEPSELSEEIPLPEPPAPSEEIPLPEPPPEQETFESEEAGLPARMQSEVFAQPRQSEQSAQMQPFVQWSEVLEKLRGISPMMYAVLNQSKAYLRGDYLLIDAPNSQFTDLVKGDSRHKTAIRNAAYTVTGVRYKLGPYPRQKQQEAVTTDKMEDFIHKFGSVVDVD